MHYVHKKAKCGPEIATFRTKTLHFLRVIRLKSSNLMLYVKIFKSNVIRLKTSNHFLVNSSAKNSLKKAKNVKFFLFCILVDRPMEGGYSPRLPQGYATAGTASYYGKSGPD